MIKTALLAAAAMAAIGAVVPAQAESVSVSYRDLDLTTPEGRNALSKRIDDAARSACGYGKMQTGTRVPSRAASACYKQARNNSRATMAAILDQVKRGS